MDTSLIEHLIAIVGGVVVGGSAVVALKNDWSATGLDGNVTKIMLGLMAFGCLLAILAAFGVLGNPISKGGA